MRNYYLDLEFNQRVIDFENGHVVYDLISVGLVDEAGRTYYAVSNEFNLEAARENEFVKDTVLPRLDMPESGRKTRAQIRKEILDFIGNEPDEKAFIHFWHIPQDWVLFSDLMSEGNFMQLPKNIINFPRNLTETWMTLGRPDILPQVDSDKEHNSLVDAKWLAKVHEVLKAYRPS